MIPELDGARCEKLRSTLVQMGSILLTCNELPWLGDLCLGLIPGERVDEATNELNFTKLAYLELGRLENLRVLPPSVKDQLRDDCINRTRIDERLKAIEERLRDEKHVKANARALRDELGELLTVVTYLERKCGWDKDPVVGKLVGEVDAQSRTLNDVVRGTRRRLVRKPTPV